MQYDSLLSGILVWVGGACSRGREQGDHYAHKLARTGSNPDHRDSGGAYSGEFLCRPRLSCRTQCKDVEAEITEEGLLYDTVELFCPSGVTTQATEDTMGKSIKQNFSQDYVVLACLSCSPSAHSFAKPPSTKPFFNQIISSAPVASTHSANENPTAYEHETYTTGKQNFGWVPTPDLPHSHW
eukprot:1455530-Amphidinium_carterae.1